MQLSAHDLDDLSQLAISAAREAGALIASYANTGVAVQHKPGGDSPAAQVVTEVDLKSEAIIVSLLAPSCERYALALLTEESADDRARLDKDHFWCVDPMDGTLAFTESIPGYAVSIALVARDGTPLIGVVYDPVTHTLYSAVAGQGVMRNGEPWEIGSTTTGAPLTLVCDRGLLQQPATPALLAAIETMAHARGLSGLQVVERNGAVLNACYVLTHAPACYFKCPKPQQGGGSLWDFAATAALFREAGRVASDVHGQPLDLNRADSTYMNHRGVLYATDASLAAALQAVLAG